MRRSGWRTRRALRQTRVRGAALGLAAALLLVGLEGSAAPQRGPARAPATSDREKERTALYREGVALGEAGRWKEAADKFRGVVAIRSAPPAVFTLAQAEERLGHFTVAEGTYRTAYDDAVAAGNQEVAVAAQAALRALDGRFPRVVVRVASRAGGGPVTDTICSVDGEGVALDTPTKVDPGEHTVVVRAPEARPFEHRVIVAEGQRVDVVATLVPEAGAPEAAVEPRTTRPLPAGPLVLGGVGVAAGVAGYLVRAGGASDYDAASASCPGGRCTSQAALDDANAARGTMLTGTVVMAAGGAALLGAGLWWFLTRAPTPASAGTPLGIGVSVAGRADGAQATVLGRF